MENRQEEIDKNNQAQYWKVLAQLDPELYRIKLALEETKINPIIIPRFIRSLANLLYGTGHGRVSTYVVRKQVTNIRMEESDQLNVVGQIDTEE